jgi:hypothetical protein
MTDKIVAAILTASMCHGKHCDQMTYLQTYDEFITSLKARAEAKKKANKKKKPTMNISKDVLRRAAERPRRR